MRVPAYQFDQGIASESMGQLPRLGLVEPHQRCFHREALIHAERQRYLHRLERVITAVGIARIVGLAHAADQHADVASIGDRGRIGEKQQIAARHEGGRQTLRADADLCRLGQRRVGQPAQLAHRDQVVVTEPRCPKREEFAQRSEYPRSHLQFDRVALAVVEADGLNPFIARQCPGEAGRRVLSAREQN